MCAGSDSLDSLLHSLIAPPSRRQKKIHQEEQGFISNHETNQTLEPSGSEVNAERETLEQQRLNLEEDGRKFTHEKLDLQREKCQQIKALEKNTRKDAEKKKADLDSS